MDSTESGHQFPVIQIWEDILVTPIVGELDPQRSEILMEKLLQETKKNGARVVIVDLSGVAGMDTQVCKQILDMGEAVRLMGAQYVACGIQPDQTQSMIKLGLNLEAVQTEQDLQSALEYSLDILGLDIREVEDSP